MTRLKRTSPEFGFGLFLVQMGHFRLEFPDFLLHFVPHLFALFPVEAHVACLVLDAVGLDEGGQGGGDAAQHGLVAAFLLQFQLLPSFR